MVLRSCQSSLAAIRQQSQLEQETMNTGQFTYPLETSTTMSGVPTGMVLLCLGFLASSKVRTRSQAGSSTTSIQLIWSFAAEKRYKDNAKFRKYRHQLFHDSLSEIFKELKPAFTTPEVVCYGDGHYRRLIYGFGPYIADYPEQCLVASIMQGWCPRYVLSMFEIWYCSNAFYFPRCLAPADDLDNPAFQNNPCMLEHTQTILENLELGELWDAYGLVGDVVVSAAF